MMSLGNIITMPFIPDSFVQDLKSRVTLSDVIRKYVTLSKRGHQWVGLSPFKSEKTASFFVNDQKSYYHCFSTNKHGDALSFIQEMDNLNFVEAIEKLAIIYGMEIPADNSQKSRAEFDEKKQLIKVMEFALQCYQNELQGNNLQNNELQAFLQKRGIGKKMVKYFNLGFAPASFDFLISKLKGKFSLDLALKAGLVQVNSKKKYYDKFRNRLIFPIYDIQNRVIAFGGRTLDIKSNIKYLNSPTTPIFHKSQQLFNLNNINSRKFSKLEPSSGQNLAQKQVIIAEGYMDVLALTEFGFINSLAPLGTAVSLQQIAKIFNYCDNPIFCFDGDQAGEKAAYRVAELCLEILKPGKTLQFIFLENKMDPDDYLRTQGKEKFKQLITNALSLEETLWQGAIYKICGEYSQDVIAKFNPSQKALINENLRNLIKQIKNSDIRLYMGEDFKNRISKLSIYASKEPDKSDINRQDNGFSKYSHKKKHITFEMAIIAALVRYPKTVLSYKDEIINFPFVDKQINKICLEVFEELENISSELYQSLLNEADNKRNKHNENIKHIDNEKLFTYIEARVKFYYHGLSLTKIMDSQLLIPLACTQAFSDAEDVINNIETLLREKLNRQGIAKDLSELGIKAGIDQENENRWRMAVMEKWKIDELRRKE